MIKLLSKAVKAGAVFAAISTGLFYSLYTEILKVKILEKLTQEQLFTFLMTSLGAFVLLAIIGMTLSSKKQDTQSAPKKHLESTNNSVTVDNSGLFNSLKIFKKKK